LLYSSVQYLFNLPPLSFKKEMKLKFRPIYLESGRPIAFLSVKFAKKHNFTEESRIEVSHAGKKLILPINLVRGILDEEEISFSEEAVDYLKPKRGSKIELQVALEPRSTQFILKKLNSGVLSRNEIYEIISDITNNALNEAEIAYFVSAVYHNGMSSKETVYLTDAMARTGRVLKWPKSKIVADKHSIGGIPGNRTTPLVVAICAAAGLTIPKTSSRSITTAAATADVLEVVTNIELSPEKLQKVVNKTSACLAWGGSLGLAPADDKLIRVERMLNLDPTSQLIASILSKKLAVGSTHVLIDIPYGDGAKVSLTQGKSLSSLFKNIARPLGLKLKVVLTPGSQPIGNSVGPVLEMIDVYKILNQEKDRPIDLEEKAIFLSGELLELTGKSKNGPTLARQILKSKSALKKFEEIINAQGKKPFSNKKAKFSKKILASTSGKISKIKNKPLNVLGRALGCPTSPTSGFIIHKHLKNNVKKSEPLITLYAETKRELAEGIAYYNSTRPFEIK
jgi:thymidine phosphorylase